MSRAKKVFIGLGVATSLLLAVRTTFTAEQYKNTTRNEIARIADGKIEKAVSNLENYLREHPGDLESMYGLAVAHTQTGQIEKALEYVKDAVKGGLPFDRFVVGPRDLLEPLTKTAEFKELAEKFANEFIHGPMVGCVQPTSAKFWLRTADEVPAQVLVSKTESMDDCIKSPAIKTDAEKDYTAVLPVAGLEPATRYYYRIIVDGKTQTRTYSFRTFGVKAKPAKFSIGFGGGAGYTPKYERMWNTINSREPLAFLLLGDNVYIDHPKSPAVQKYCYYRRQCRPEFRNFASATAVYAIWDDHDFTTNDSWGGPATYEPEWKLPVWRLFKYNWNNPYYAGGKSQPGCWFDFSISDVDFFMLDGRYYRMNPKQDNPRMLGPVQMKWLKDKLKASKATFKVIASPVPWSYGAKPGSRDPWQGYKAEREEIFSFLEKNRIDGVILIAADRHRSDIWKIERPDGYDLYEFESSKISNIHTHGIMKGSIFGYNKKCSFGMITFDTTLPDPQLTYTIVSIDDETIYEFSLKKSQLSHTKTR